MKQTARPTQIEAILKTIVSEYPVDTVAPLEAYIHDLETKQPERPAQITAILESMEADHRVDMGTFLETYISDLEARQQIIPSGKNASVRDPSWMYWHGVERARQRRERALRKQNSFQ